METDKATMRRIYRQKRDEFVASLASRERDIAFSQITTPMAAHLLRGKIVAGYIAKDSEADPTAILLKAHEIGCVTALPHVISRSAPMRFLRWSPGDILEPGPFGLLQPSTDAEAILPDVVLVPLVAFDSRLMRLGQGAGHYDRGLSLLDQCFAIGIAWSIQHAPAIETDPWDIPMNAILTEKSWTTL
jgi:5-formyltetrahydrofolate cyclo-ligase